MIHCLFCLRVGIYGATDYICESTQWGKKVDFCILHWIISSKRSNARMSPKGSLALVLLSWCRWVAAWQKAWKTRRLCYLHMRPSHHISSKVVSFSRLESVYPPDLWIVHRLLFCAIKLQLKWQCHLFGLKTKENLHKRPATLSYSPITDLLTKRVIRITMVSHLKGKDPLVAP